jgi:hypothetical protein
MLIIFNAAAVYLVAAVTASESVLVNDKGSLLPDALWGAGSIDR